MTTVASAERMLLSSDSADAEVVVAESTDVASADVALADDVLADVVSADVASSAAPSLEAGEAFADRDSVPWDAAAFVPPSKTPSGPGTGSSAEVTVDEVTVPGCETVLD
ncbi:hypothetical protein, partial [Burkholderia multivorans]|uniref:hypothetical protein n=1 Tax=Burkholderia multivorans TaxID=87883 RepID=UPI0015EC4F66